MHPSVKRALTALRSGSLSAGETVECWSIVNDACDWEGGPASVASGSGLDIAISSIELFSDSGPVLGVVCSVLQKIVVSSSLAKRVFKIGGVNALARALSKAAPLPIDTMRDAILVIGRALSGMGSVARESQTEMMISMARLIGTRSVDTWDAVFTTAFIRTFTLVAGTIHMDCGSAEILVPFIADIMCDHVDDVQVQSSGYDFFKMVCNRGFESTVMHVALKHRLPPGLEALYLEAKARSDMMATALIEDEIKQAEKLKKKVHRARPHQEPVMFDMWRGRSFCIAGTLVPVIYI